MVCVGNTILHTPHRIAKTKMKTLKLTKAQCATIRQELLHVLFHLHPTEEDRQGLWQAYDILLPIISYTDKEEDVCQPQGK